MTPIESLTPDAQKEQKRARRNEIVRCQTCGIELPRKNLKKHKRTAHSTRQEQIALDRSPRSAVKKTVTSDGTVVFSTAPKRLEDVPLEYQAAVYAKMEREKLAKQDAKRRTQLQTLRASVKALKVKLRNTHVESARIDLEKEIAAHEKAMKKAPKPKRKWSLILPGSFESGKKK